MECSCIKGDYRFTLDYSSCRELLYRDISLWMEVPGYEIPETYSVIIASPTMASNTLTLQVKTTNVLTPSDLGLPSECMPDGFYTFSTTSCDVPYSMTTSIMCNLECCFQNMKANSSVRDLDAIKEIELYINNARVTAEAGDHEEFEMFYDMAKTILNSYNCDCNCP